MVLELMKKQRCEIDKKDEEEISCFDEKTSKQNNLHISMYTLTNIDSRGRTSFSHYPILVWKR